MRMNARCFNVCMLYVSNASNDQELGCECVREQTEFVVVAMLRFQLCRKDGLQQRRQSHIDKWMLVRMQE